MRRALPLLACALVLGACGDDDETKTVTVSQTAPATQATTAPPTTETGAADEDAILTAVVQFYEAKGASVPRADLKLVKTNGRFADVLVAGEAHAILKKATPEGGEDPAEEGAWVVVFDGNGAIPPELRREFSIPPDYGG